MIWKIQKPMINNFSCDYGEINRCILTCFDVEK